MYLALLLSLTLAVHAQLPPTQESLHFTADMKGFLVHLHNKLRTRALPPPASMAEISWDDTLEAYAADWATCGDNYFTKRDGENKIQPYGETMAISGSENDVFTDGIPAAIVSAVDAWWKERNSFLYDKGRCVYGTHCESYLQVAWAKTTAIGCAYALNCRDPDRTEASWNHNFYIVCYYNPEGNTAGELPYQRLPNSNVRTRGGTARGLNCVFPFQYKDKMYSSCIKSADTDTPWCRVEDGSWGYCIPEGVAECSDKSTSCYVYTLINYGGFCPAESSLSSTEVTLKNDCRRFCKYCSCDLVCKNGGQQTMDCGCLCQGSWAGDDCSFCPITSCKNGGTFDAANCKCNCANGYGGTECDCKDNPEQWVNHGDLWSCTWDWIITNGLCTCNYYGPAIVNNCPGLCNVCIEPLALLREY